jgi:hypothetical protein
MTPPRAHCDEPDTPASRPWALQLAAGMLVLLTLSMLLGGPEQAPGGTNSYDAGPGGFRAAYLLLKELDYPVARSRQGAGGAARWVLHPKLGGKPGVLDDWARAGGRVLLADPSGDFALQLGLTVRRVPGEPGGRLLEGVTGVADVGTLAPGEALVEPDARGREWGRAGGRPLVSVHALGRGEVWLLHRPDLFSNSNLRKADNAVLLCRLADALREGRRGDLAFDEFVHGMRDRPGVAELLLRPPTLYPTLAALVFTGVLLWHHAPRFGARSRERPQRRRSKEEFLDAMAELLDRKADFRDAFDTVRRRVVREVEADLGLAAGTAAEELLDEVERRRPGGAAALRRALRPEAVPRGAGRNVFVSALNDLEAAYDEFSQRPSR